MATGRAPQMGRCGILEIHRQMVDWGIEIMGTQGTAGLNSWLRNQWCPPGETNWHSFVGLGPPVVPFYPLLLGEGSPTKMDYRKKGTLILSSVLEDLVGSITQWLLGKKGTHCFGTGVVLII